MWRVFFGAGIYFLCVSVGPSFSTDFDLKSLPGPGPSHPTVPISRETTGGIPPSTIKIAPPTSLPLSDPCDVTGKSLYELQKIYKHCRIRTAPANTEDEEVTGGLDEPQIANAKALRRFFRSDLRVEPLICQALLRLYDEKPSKNGCEGRVTNHVKSVSYLVTATDSVAGTYEVELLGKSSELALKSPHWIERHRFYVALGFSRNLEPQITVIDFEPMVRTTAELFPERSDLFEHIGLEHDSEIRVLQDRIKSSIAASLQQATEAN
ncbi:hypothetical protein JJC00_07050 [Bradyrhizobium diazoefficiens]|uniref:hypothetical protein n=1 Tax=Bradyrhizobium diazoefficiens TaxID=1355477 RepID=UPI00190BFD5F|nr:hypothetical protein [Bradyrhizobium diazoefficiens]QQO35411.1 hypothetical protein JJC00_07050 [Bradyrhizobium diazoefficiens]